jgi:hypothetical protein
MGAMFVWNLDWADYGWLCEPARFFSVLRDDYGTYALLPSLTQPTQSASRVWEAVTPCYATTLAYDALAGMEKRPGYFGPRLALAPPSLSFLADLERPGAFAGVVVPMNMGYGVFTWTATVAGGMGLTPTLVITTGEHHTPLTIMVDSTGYPTGTFTGIVSVTSTTLNVLDAPQAVTVTLRVLSGLYTVYLPVTLRSAP